MSEHQLRNLLAEIDLRRQALRDKRKKHMQELAELICPYKVGEVITIKGPVHTGKKGEVISICCRYVWRTEYIWAVYVAVLKKNGNHSSRSTGWTQFEEASP